ncbi:MAG: hypothetical protein H6745_28675 [Deltaproteobacteria bacterium]|nr:hypothetical protein [Deltaproteobacteria bacterium]
MDDARLVARGLPEGAARDALLARVELAAGDAPAALACAGAAVARAATPPEEVEARLVLGLALAASGVSASDEAARAWEIASVSLPLGERLAVGLALRPLLAEPQRAELDSDVAFALDDVPATLPARRRWEGILT